jgi:hypothetical protein
MLGYSVRVVCSHYSARRLQKNDAPWLKKRDIALLGWETPDYAPKPPTVAPLPIPKGTGSPVNPIAMF